MIRIANGQGFWGDWLEAPARLVAGGPLDYLTLDYLAEVTMSILQKQRKANRELGYARDFPPAVARIAAEIKRKNIKVVANAGGVNPIACARELLRLAPSLKIVVVLGDDILDRIDELVSAGQPLENIDTHDPITVIRDRIESANVYLGAFPLAEALDTGADVVITGRCADAALALAPMIHEFKWKEDDWDLLAAGVTAGHLIECGTQATGGNCTLDWQSMPDYANIGYPHIEAEPDGTMVITKHAGTGGRVTIGTVSEQLVYEIGDPRRYMTPDVVADFTSISLHDDGLDRVRISGAKGSARPSLLKASISYHYGWKATGTLAFALPDAHAKAACADRILRERLSMLGLEFEKVHTEIIGSEMVQLRVAVRGSNKKAVGRFTRELIPLVLSGPPGATGYGEGRPEVREIVAYWPALVPREAVQPRIEVIEA